MVAIEAMASGTLIASNIGGLKYVVAPGQTGLLFPPGNTAILAHAIARLIKQPELCAKLSRDARARVDELFTWNDIAEGISEFYTELIEAQNLELLNRSLQYSMKAYKRTVIHQLLEHIQVETNMSIDKFLSIKRRFTRSL